MSVRCHCARPKRDPRKTVGGEVIAILCLGCTRTIKQRCRVCRQFFAELAIHHGKTMCGDFDRRGMWWTAERPPNAGQLGAAAQQGELFP
jgi:hypothetical protein